MNHSPSLPLDSSPDAPDGSTARRPGIRLWPAATIVALVGGAITAVWLGQDHLAGAHVVLTMMLVGVALFSLLGWWTFLSRLTWPTRFVGLAVVGVVSLLLVIFLRRDAWDGQMRPILAWRWTPTAEEQFDASQTADSPGGGDVPTPAGSAAKIDHLDAPWPQYLGPDRLGVVKDLRLKRDWVAHPPEIVWQRAVGLGWSSFAVAGGLAVTQEQRGEDECVVAYDLATGEPRWVHADAGERFRESLGGDGPRATPTIQGGRVYAQGATGLLNCLDLATGVPIWPKRINILVDAGLDPQTENLTWAMSGSPLLVDDLVIVTPGAVAEGTRGYTIAAYDRTSGRRRWTGGKHRAAYTSPMLATLAGKRQIVYFHADGISGFDLLDGRELWSFAHTNGQGILCSQPLALAQYGEADRADQFLATSGYAVGSVLVEISQREGRFAARSVWPQPSPGLKSKFSHWVVRDGYVYGLDEGILACVSLEDGRRMWKRGRYGHGQLVLVDDLLLIQDELGDVVLVEASPQAFREVARTAALADKTWNTLAVAGRLLLVRNDRQAMCLKLPVAGQ
jgi:outer membrane protein assembly factor BamB